MKLSFKKAKEASLIKWKYVMTEGCDNNNLMGWLAGSYPYIRDYKWQCGFCERWEIDGAISLYSAPDCSSCELYEKQHRSCVVGMSNYSQWIQAKTKKTRIKYATKIYNDIKSLKEGNK